MVALQHALSLLKIKVQPHGGQNPNERYQVTHYTYFQAEMVDTIEGGKISIFAHYLLESYETPFRVVLDPQIGNLNQVLAT